MNRNDLRTGDLLQFRNEDFYVCMKSANGFGANDIENYLINIEDGTNLTIDEYRLDLSRTDENFDFDIIRIYRGYVGDVVNLINRNGSLENLKQIWEEPKNISMDEMMNLFKKFCEDKGYQLNKI